jgi:hypothetical protein
MKITSVTLAKVGPDCSRMAHYVAKTSQSRWM